MSTRSIIAKPRGHGIPPRAAKPTGFFNKLLNQVPRPQFEGVYHHNGGGPSDMGPMLWNLMHNRYHLRAEDFWREIIYSNPAGWSSLLCFYPPAAGEPNFAVTWDGKTKVGVDEAFEYFQRHEPDPGPTTYQGDPQRHLPGVTDILITEDDDKRMAVFIYVVTPTELVIMLTDENDRGVEKVRVAWQDPEPDWEAVDKAMDTEGDEDDEDEDDESDSDDEETDDDETDDDETDDDETDDDETDDDETDDD